MDETVNILSYANILNDFKRFKKSGTRHGDDFNMFDTPAHKYFKILFYFGSSNPDSNVTGEANGLLHPTWEIYKGESSSTSIYSMDYELDSTKYKGVYEYNSAWSFLMQNDEKVRAEHLEQFVTLLSDINTKSPWYFSQIGGLGDALERKMMDDGKLEMADKKLTITCLPDAFDNRIDTLLSLYREITYSWANKRQVLPVNLRKFDMAVYIFETPEKNWHSGIKSTTKNDPLTGQNQETTAELSATIGVEDLASVDGDLIAPSYKMIEFHDCEINYNSIKSGYSEINNQTGANPTYTIEITYADCYEVTYNDIMVRHIGDMILTDLYQLDKSNNPTTHKSNGDPDISTHNMINRLDSKSNPYANGKDVLRGDTLGAMADSFAKRNVYERLGNINNRANSSIKEDINDIYEVRRPSQGFIANAVGQAVGTVVGDLKNTFKRAVLGNLYGYSLSQVGQYAKDVLSGNLIPVLQKSGVDVNSLATKGGAMHSAAMKNLYGDKASGDPTAQAGSGINRTSPEPSGNINTSRLGVVTIKRSTPKSSMGNIYSASTIANNT